MPSKVSTFFGRAFDLPDNNNTTTTHNNIFSSVKGSSTAAKDKKSRRNSLSLIHPGLGARSSSAASISTVASPTSPKMAADAIKRLSLTSITAPKHASPKSSSRNLAAFAELEICMESPPLLFLGPPALSSGALLSGVIKVKVHVENLAVEAFKMKLALERTMKKPFHAHCQECSQQISDLSSWSFIDGPATLHKGEHTYPFSFLLQGSHPATTSGVLSSIDYMLRATLSTKSSDPILLAKSLDVKRALMVPELPRNSMRIFPPTSITAHCELPPIIHPIGESTAHVRMDGVIKKNFDTKMLTIWRLKRLTWRLEETHKTISLPCPRHLAKQTAKGQGEVAKRGVSHQDVRTIGMDELRDGWKTDYSTADGNIEIEFPFRVRADVKPVCDVRDGGSTEVSHALIVELIITEEMAPLNRANHPTPTGSARVLRMHFNITISERAGMGIAWDEEQPPLYENVPASPPRYVNAEEIDMAAIPEYADLLPLDSASQAAVNQVPSVPTAQAPVAGPSNSQSGPGSGRSSTEGPGSGI